MRFVHSLLDSWRSIGLIVVGMARQGFQVSMAISRTDNDEEWEVVEAPSTRTGGKAVLQ